MAACCCSKSKLAVSRMLLFQSQSLKRFLIRSPAILLKCQLSTGVPPKRPGNSYIQFSKDTRPNLTAENPDKPVSEISKLIAELWRELPAEEKDQYVRKAKMLEEKYQNELKEFESSISDVELDEIKEEKKLKRVKRAKRREKTLLRKLDKPKKARQAFSYYVMSRASEFSGFSKDLMVKLSEDWNSMTEEEKAVFKQRAKEDGKRYEVEMEEWEDRMVMEGHPELLRKVSMQKLMKRTEGDVDEEEED
ncbi:transcription factor A, mitochondrial-like [Anneissia japonica]|uniref:transcription factor A, mitochondrial-like n=1 Tax=Anneissia japonica TaxID=1529436 RepID=UPI001425AB8E|nr:transcription factor A, mitochondrial-like [Anneissia japonica]